MSSLHQASITGNVEIIKLLIENGAKLDLKDNKGMRSLHYAAYNGKTDILNLLLRCGSNSNEPTFNGDTPMHFAAQMGHADIVYQMLNFGADVSLTNTSFLSALDVACEHGRTKCVEILLQSGLCISLVRDKSKDLIDAKLSTTCLHLAAKNNHTDIIRLLLLFGIDINRFTHQGTALHEACRYGRYQAAKLLLECGIDLNHANFQDQLASDVVIKQKVGNDIKRIIKEFSECVHAISVQPYLDNHAGSLIFQKDEYITVLERNPSGNWRGFILQNDFTTRFGYFPSVYVRLIDRTSSKSNQTVLQPQVTQKAQPNMGVNACAKVALNVLNSGKISRFTSNTIQNQAQLANIDEVTCDISPIGSVDSSSKISVQSSNAADSGISSHKSLNQSPPHSSLSLTLEQNTIYESSSQIYSKTVSTSTLRSFTNSKTNFLLPSLNEDIYSPSTTISASSPQHHQIYESDNTVSVTDLIRSGLKDSEIIFNWLNEINLSGFYENFVNAGYDLLTLMKMTPSDLIAIGICDPGQRKSILQHMRRLNVRDLDEKLNKLLKNVHSVKHLLELIHLEQYLKAIMQQGYLTIGDLAMVSCEDLEDIGIRKLGHQKKFMLTIKRLQQCGHEANDGEAVAVGSKAMNRMSSAGSMNGMNHARSCENVAMLCGAKEDIFKMIRGGSVAPTHTSQKPIPPKRTDSIMKVNESIKVKMQAMTVTKEAAATSCYATLPRKRSQVNQKFYADHQPQVGRDIRVDQQHKQQEQHMPFANGNMVKQKMMQTEHGNGHSINKAIQNAVNVNTKNDYVLTDIDSMLSDLNKQLDDMLEYEKSFKNY